MDIFGMLNIPNWIIIFTLTFFVCYLYLTRKYSMKLLGMPGPTPLPLIGNWLQDLFSIMHEADVVNNKKYGRVYCFYEGTRATFRVSDPAILKEVLVKQFNNFTDRRHVDLAPFDPVLAKMISLLHGEEWKMTRNVMSPTFTSGKLKQMVSLIDKCTKRFVEVLGKKADSGESVDAKDIYISYLLEIIGTCAFGVEINASAKSNDKSFLDYARRLIFTRRIVTFFFLGIIPKRLASALNITIFDSEAMNYIKEMLRSVTKARESGNEKRNDFLQIMLDALKEANANALSEKNSEDKEVQGIKAVLTPDGVLAQCILFFFAGFETTSTALCYISYAVATNPECQNKLIDEVDRILQNNEGKIDWDTIAQMTYMDKFIAEALRMYPPAIRAKNGAPLNRYASFLLYVINNDCSDYQCRTDRQCTQDTQIGELRIPKGTIITIPAYAMHHDEEFYPDPYRFDPERFSPENKEQRDPYTYLAFGIGPRNCIAMRFALMQVKLTLIHMLKNLRICLAPKTQDPLVFKRGSMQLAPVGGIHVIFTRRFE